jgi:hypothetical protein
MITQASGILLMVLLFETCVLVPTFDTAHFPVVKMEKAQPPAEGANKNVSAATIHLQALNKADWYALKPPTTPAKLEDGEGRPRIPKYATVKT